MTPGKARQYRSREEVERDLKRASPAIFRDPLERSAMRMQDKIDSCGEMFARLDKVEGEGDQRTRRAMFVPLRCGHRACKRCGSEMRREGASRMRHPWKSTITLGVTRAVTSDVAWSRMSGWISRWMSAYRSWMREHEPGVSTEYAWVLENHFSGYPHAHIVLARSCRGPRARWMRFWKWARSAWRSITGLATRWIYIKELRNVTATQAYIVKYLHKASYNVWHYALIGKKRMWGTSLKAPEKLSKGFSLVKIVTELEDPLESGDTREVWLKAGWDIEWASDLGASQWIRREDEPEKGEWLDDHIRVCEYAELARWGPEAIDSLASP